MIYPTLHKRRLIAAFIFSGITFVLAAMPGSIQASPEAQQSAAASLTPDAAVRQFTSAYNQADVDAMAALMHPKIEWLSIEGSTVQTVARGREALIADLRQHMAGAPEGNRSELGPITVTGGTASVVETAYWVSSNGDTRAQSSLAVYETIDGLIRRIWYFPAQSKE